MNRNPRAAGFTLLELMVVLVILVIALGLAVPLLHDGSGRRTALAAERLAQRLEQARQEAVLSSRVWRLVLDLDAGAYHFERRDTADFAAISEDLFAATDDLEFDDCIVNGAAVTGVAEVHLYPTGEQDALRLTLRSGEHRRLVTLNAVGPPGVSTP